MHSINVCTLYNHLFDVYDLVFFRAFYAFISLLSLSLSVPHFSVALSFFDFVPKQKLHCIRIRSLAVFDL